MKYMTKKSAMTGTAYRYTLADDNRRQISMHPQ
jgi:hypothetical protein